MMKAIVVHQYGPPEVMQAESVPPPTAGPGHILVDLKAVGVNPVDTYIRAGWYPVKSGLPYTPGADGAGIVTQVGAGVTTVSTGDRVFVCGSLSGTYAQQTRCLLEQVFALPDNISFEQGAALGVPYGTAYRALFNRAKALAGQTVLVHGATGGVGIAAVQLAVAAGLTVIATAGTDDGCRLTLRQGAHHALRHDDPERVKKVLEQTDGRGVDIVLEMLANVNLDCDLDMVAIGGCVVVIGSRGRIEIDPRKTMTRGSSILGMPTVKAAAAEIVETYRHIQTGLKTGRLKPVIAQELPLEQSAQAHHRVMESGHHGKIVLIP